MRIITKELAVRIAEKFGATYEDVGPHTIAYISYKGKRVAQFGIRRASEKDKGHDYVPKQIYLSAYQAKEFAYCNISVNQWAEILIKKGVIPPDQETPPAGSTSEREPKS